MRRERKQEQKEERFLARQIRLRERRQRKMNSLPVFPMPGPGSGPPEGLALAVPRGTHKE